ncbi:hypothetical protein C1I98_34740 [Spongiactinospora gelatinilytica]|uniref:Putative restriction endonuclease domain-containing protein n=1 Tax=Spongiactinospora gelatinilytica TaxID=2666298 RepID=A0A2W2FAF4_9ACTN|nr:hypothetical protein C1I98_34740 [Spongiactinospora gelatinilytica]
MIVSRWGDPRQSWIISLLVMLLGPVADARGWRVWPSLDVRTAHTCEPLIPDLAIGPKDAPRWGEDEILSNGLVLVAEVVSRSSVREDREDKPVIYAKSGVPFMLVVDPIAEPPTVTLWSDPGDDGYRTVTKVKMGEEPPVPQPSSDPIAAGPNPMTGQGGVSRGRVCRGSRRAWCGCPCGSSRGRGRGGGGWPGWCGPRRRGRRCRGCPGGRGRRRP